MLVHVIGKWPGQRFQFDFKDGTADDFVLRTIKSQAGRLRCGRSGWLEKVDDVTGMKAVFADPESPFLVDDPASVIAVVTPTPDGWATEVKRLAGPPPDQTADYIPMLR